VRYIDQANKVDEESNAAWRASDFLEPLALCDNKDYRSQTKARHSPAVVL